MKYFYSNNPDHQTLRLKGLKRITITSYNGYDIRFHYGSGYYTWSFDSESAANAMHKKLQKLLPDAVNVDEPGVKL